MSPKIDVITLGVNDLEQAGAFYAGAFGAPVSRDEDALNASLGPNASRICLRDWDEVANDAGLPSDSRGFRAFTLSYILKSAADVDRILSRAEHYGGQVSKPPRNAVWGYSAHVTDPSGYLWKIASSKRRPVLRREQSVTGNGHVVRPEEVPITIGVADMARAKRFYEEGLGLPVKKAFGNKFVMFSGEGGGSGLGMYKREALAHDAAVLPEGSGFRGFSLTHAVDTAERVDELLARVEGAGATIVKSAARADRGGYSGCFADPDGNLWRVASQN
jgi:catechol 2,3-dioxygenase-like lactoylglutathione lyase family enzyme